MKIQKFRIKNYKSIIDSGDCYLDSKITILAGKNESGKTTILEALSDFNVETTIDKNKIPLTNSKLKPQIIITFEVNKKEILDCFGRDFSDWFEKNGQNELEIIKSYPNNYDFSKEINNKLKTITNSNENKKQFIEVLSIFHREYPNVFSPEMFSLSTSSKFLEFKTTVNEIQDYINDSDYRNHPDNLGQMEHLFREIKNIFFNLNESKIYEDNCFEKVKKLIPNFVLFTSFRDFLPNQIPIKDLEKNDWTKALNNIIDLDFDLIKSKNNNMSKENHINNINININNNYNNCWKQDSAKLSIGLDQNNLFFWVKENGITYQPSMRSDGKRWHLSFYIKITSGISKEKKNVILIDEPGLFLHAQAQKDILKLMENVSENTNIIFSTHSPYLLEFTKLNRIKLVVKDDKKGTKIENKIHSTADKEILTPILTAIGLNLNAGIEGVNKLKNVIVEGISDVYYLQAFKQIRKQNEEADINFISGGGSSNMPFVGTIIHGWGGKVIYLYDNDKGGKNGKKTLKNKWKINEDLTLFVSDFENDKIENIFTKEDYKKFVLKNNLESQNKVFESKQFLQLVENEKNLKLSVKTIQNIEKLFQNINEIFKKLIK